MRNLIDNATDRTMLNINLSNVYNEVSLVMGHNHIMSILTHILTDSVNKDFSIYADYSLEYMIIKLCYGLTLSTIYCMQFISAICILLQDISPMGASPVPISNANNNALSEKKDDEFVVNLAQYNITDAQQKLLSRGLKFCPTPGEPDVNTYQTDLDQFHLRIERYIHFFRQKNPNVTRNTNVATQSQVNASQVDHLSQTINDDPFHHQSFKKPSAWVPPPKAAFEAFISKNKLDLAESIIPPPGKSNISLDEKRALRQLSNNPNIVIKLVDKGGAVVIQNREDQRQLSDPNFTKI